jgi:hypothetical protein
MGVRARHSSARRGRGQALRQGATRSMASGGFRAPGFERPFLRVSRSATDMGAVIAVARYNRRGSRPGSRCVICRGKSGLRRTRRQVTPGGRKPTESATESKPPKQRINALTARVKRCGKSAPRRWQHSTARQTPPGARPNREARWLRPATAVRRGFRVGR